MSPVSILQMNQIHSNFKGLTPSQAMVIFFTYPYW